jgi:hypothetical protein
LYASISPKATNSLSASDYMPCRHGIFNLCITHDSGKSVPLSPQITENCRISWRHASIEALEFHALNALTAFRMAFFCLIVPRMSEIAQLFFVDQENRHVGNRNSPSAGAAQDWLDARSGYQYQKIS